MIGLNASYSSVKCTRVRPSPSRLEARPAGRVRPQRLADRVVAPRFVRLHFGEPFPRLADAARAATTWAPGSAVPHEPVPVVVAGMEDLDARVDVAAVADGRAPRYQKTSHTSSGGGVELDRELVALHSRSACVRRAASAPTPRAVLPAPVVLEVLVALDHDVVLPPEAVDAARHDRRDDARRRSCAVRFRRAGSGGGTGAPSRRRSPTARPRSRLRRGRGSTRSPSSRHVQRRCARSRWR